MIGKTLGHYQISSQLGKGGMGEVYRAKDQKLGRDVAIKVLPEEFARDADRVARFQREAKLLASLNHPNIAAIHGLEEFGGTNFLVLELVDGDTLADRIKAGSIPVEEALKLALQIAEALEAAHEKGVIHRDLKPANIKVTPDGKVKVLDFGLAKAFAGNQADLNLSNSPTLSDMATQQGVILGTAAYMSPEQARGKAVDKRADIWAFGCVLYEILTGQPAFQGEDVTEILASVVKGGANLDLLPENLHPRVRETITRCLQRDLNRRYQDIRDAQYEIDQTFADPSGVLTQPVAITESRKKMRTILPWAAAALVLGLIIAGVAVWKLKPSEPRQVIRFGYELPEGQQLPPTLVPAGRAPLAVAPDGRQFVYSTTNGLYLRSVDESTARLIAGTEGATQQPFFSPDGNWIGYQCNRQLRKISINGGVPVTLCEVMQRLGAWWSADNTILYGQLLGGGIARISANGGTAEPLIEPENENPGYPQILPDGKSLLYTLYRGISGGRIVLKSPASGQPRELFAGGMARYLPTGHIIFLLQNNLFAIAFDVDRLEVKGGPVPVVEGVYHAAVSEAGTLVYIPTTAGAASENASVSGRTLVYVDRKGKEESIGAPLNFYRFPKISPDGTRVAVGVFNGSWANDDIWVWELVRKTLARLTFEGTYSVSPVWTPDGKRIAFSGMSGAGVNVSWKAADGTGKAEQLCPSPRSPFLPYGWSSDGKTLIGVKMAGMGQSFDIELLSMEGDRALKPLLRESYVENQPKISSDGRWMAYTSDESGKSEVYVRPFPEVNNGRWQISTNGGDSPLWSPDGRELFYRSGDAVMAVSVKTEPSFNIVGTPQILFRGTYVQGTPLEGSPWDIHPDGKRFLMMKPPASTGTAPTFEGPRKINVVLNWLEELKQKVPTK